MTPQEIETLFTRADGQYAFARWGRPVAPIVFGVDDATLKIVKGAIEAVAALAGHDMAETDPELGSNMMFFFFRDWDELLEVPDLDKLIPDLAALVARLNAAGANQYRAFRFDDQGAIQAAFAFVRMDEQLSEMPAETLALSQVVMVMLQWSERAFATASPLAVAGGVTVLRPDIAGVVRAAYDPVLPAVAQDASHALRLFARIQAQTTAS
ncbi:hypothetical protein TG4357_01180 [Thalassovita gelatinovora]|uniref:Uncharacterized protein n=1 Tax=Thalassovita gelatinovora TaxID=53501 RepID=A0A0P1F948_THAGE|nr:hypothetical protein [Thalassovita gelatinovora]QIZ80340.1 hypothetical protein HFZ77_07560 [Thalassovita gelatinovora]CUH64269.1 hypothetical protein TG4357_01180 [Thalassovita gelatinovora]SEQ94118.1 hypothetical protein SAMN04488043_11175 [Thalassovita gelatinovora]